MKEVLRKLEIRFNENMHRHFNLKYDDLLNYLCKDQTIKTIKMMEERNGEPDIIFYNGELLLVEFSKETPTERSICYDEEARLSRKKFPPEKSVELIAKSMNVKVVDEALYLYMQKIEPIDLKTSCWLNTPNNFRALGGALTGERRYDRVFIYHNGADSYYGTRSFRAYIVLK